VDNFEASTCFTSTNAVKWQYFQVNAVLLFFRFLPFGGIFYGGVVVVRNMNRDDGNEADASSETEDNQHVAVPGEVDDSSSHAVV